MRSSRLVWVGVLAMVVGCGDGFTPPNGDGVIIEDNNQMGEPAGSAEVLVGFPSGPMLEGGAAVTVSVSLKRPPSAPVTIALASSDEAAGTVSPATLTFEPGSFAAAQVVTLTPVDDEVATGDKKWELRFELASDDVDFNGKPVTSLKLTTIDNDAAPFIVAAATGAPQTTEQGGAATISVQLSKQPKSDVLVPVTVSDAAEAEVGTPTLTFTALDWNIAQQVVVTGKDDAKKDGDKAFKVIFGAANSVDEEFNGIGPAEVALTNIDGVCGNGVVDGAEPCEPSGMNDCEFGQMDCMVCNNACELVPGDVTGFCGDGITQFEKGEECDEPPGPCAYGEMSCMACNAQCKQVAGQPVGFCGDGQVQGQFEQCDTPAAPCAYGQMSCMSCEACQSVAGDVTGFCGDGVVQTDDGEECDGAASATCSGQGVVTCSAQCKNDRSQCLSFIKVVGGASHGCALLSNGRAGCWGTANNVNAVVTGKTGVVDIVAGSSDTCIATATRTECYGRGYLLSVPGAYTKIAIDGRGTYNNLCVINAAGSLGCDTDSFSSAFPNNVPAGSFKDVGVAFNFGCALTLTGILKCWNANNQYELQGAYTKLAVANSICLLDTAGVASCIGTGAGTTLDMVISGIFVDIDTEVRQTNPLSEYACAVSPVSGLVCWGSLPSGVPDDEAGDFVKVDAAPNHVCAIRSDGTAKCWGNTQGAMIPSMIP